MPVVIGVSRYDDASRRHFTRQKPHLDWMRGAAEEFFALPSATGNVNQQKASMRLGLQQLRIEGRHLPHHGTMSGPVASFDLPQFVQCRAAGGYWPKQGSPCRLSSHYLLAFVNTGPRGIVRRHMRQWLAQMSYVLRRAAGHLALARVPTIRCTAAPDSPSEYSRSIRQDRTRRSDLLLRRRDLAYAIERNKCNSNDLSNSSPSSRLGTCHT